MVCVHLLVGMIITDYIRRIHMSEWLTIGQMIDKLEVEEAAVSNDGIWTVKWNDDDKTLKFIDNFDDEYNSVEIYDKERLWKINRK
jgi:heme oxygenase